MENLKIPSDFFIDYMKITPEVDMFTDFINMVFIKAKRKAILDTSDEKDYYQANKDTGINLLLIHFKNFEIKNISLAKLHRQGLLPKDFVMAKNQEADMVINCNYYNCKNGYDYLRNSDYAEYMQEVLGKYGIKTQHFSNID